jgi:hypothetical protein
LGGIAMMASIAVFAIPEITKDRSCHNMFRDGRSSVLARASLNLLIGRDDRPKVASVLEHFAASHGLQSRSDRYFVSLCNGQGLIITADAMGIGLYYLGDDDGWRAPARDLIATSSRSWPGKIQFRDANGHNRRVAAGLGPN